MSGATRRKRGLSRWAIAAGALLLLAGVLAVQVMRLSAELAAARSGEPRPVAPTELVEAAERSFVVPGVPEIKGAPPSPGLPAVSARGSNDASGSGDEVASLRLERDAAIRSQGELLVRSAALSGTIDLLTAPDTRSLDLQPADPAASAAHARVYLSKTDGRLVLFGRGLAELPADRSYQTWLLAGGRPIPAGVFRPVAGRVRHEVVALPIGDGAHTVTLTVEPSGGLPAPSGPMVLRGTLPAN